MQQRRNDHVVPTLLSSVPIVSGAGSSSFHPRPVLDGRGGDVMISLPSILSGIALLAISFMLVAWAIDEWSGDDSKK